jgi:hypothetical protein
MDNIKPNRSIRTRRAARLLQRKQERENFNLTVVLVMAVVSVIALFSSPDRPAANTTPGCIGSQTWEK